MGENAKLTEVQEIERLNNEPALSAGADSLNIRVLHLWKR